MTLPQEIEKQINEREDELTANMKTGNDYEIGCQNGFGNGYRAGATEWAGKLHQEKEESKKLIQLLIQTEQVKRDELQAKCERYEALIKRIYKDGAGNANVIKEVNEALSAGVGEKEVEPMPFEDLKFMEKCNLYPHVDNSVKVLTENDEGAWLDKDALIKLSSILYRYANQKEDQQ